MAVAIILLLVAVGSVLFHIYSPWWWTPLASNWGYIDDTITLTFWITGAVFSAVVVFMAYCVFRFRHKEGRQAAYNPENKKLEWWLSIGTAIGVAAMLAPGLVVWHQFVTVPADATEVEVMGQPRKGWPAWDFRCPQGQFRQSYGVESRRSKRTRRRRHTRRRLAPAGWETGEGIAPLN